MENKFWEKSLTPVRFPKAPFSLLPSNRVAFYGSCFAEELLSRYRELSLPATESPFGIIYNPLTLGKSLSSLINRQLELKPFYHQNLWRHFAFHSSRCYNGKREDGIGAETHFDNLVSVGAGELEESDFLVITLGTAWVYREKESGTVVNNCHRCDNRLFERDCYTRWDLPASEVALERSLKQIKEKNRNITVILTVSPVRHLRNDARENSYSKALLRCLCEDLCCAYDWISYFPAYEIVMDELRDYRWYGDDLCHPCGRAVDYILSRFFEWAGSDELIEYIASAEKKLKRGRHRPLIRE